MDLDLLFQKGELIPAIIQEASTSQVLMLAYMNQMCIRDRTEAIHWAGVQREG